MKQEIEQAIAGVCKDLFDVDVRIELTRPDEQFGDYATNIALQLAKQLGKNPREVAKEIKNKLTNDAVTEVTIAGPGFLNLQLSDQALINDTNPDISGINAGKRVLLEYSCPNAFKELHTGHLYQTIVGDAIGHILEATGATVYRANFGGDVGLHVAKCLYGIIEQLGGEHPEKLGEITDNRAEWISAAYVQGAKAYEEDEAAKAAITEINKQVYGFHASNDHESDLAKIYWICREWSYDYFKDFYQKIHVAAFDAYYPESSTIEPGLTVVKGHTGKVFKKSDGAVVFEGEAEGLHTRVFITSQGLPTYEAKDLGVIFTEANDFAYDTRIIITGNDQVEYMKVVFAALQHIDAELAAKQVHFANGTIRFGSGQKMSSRLGNVTRAIDVIETVDSVISAQNPDTDHYTTALAAIKYSFLRHRLGSDIAFDVNESVSTEGNSGPYLQYAHARARSILAKTSNPVIPTELEGSLESGERNLVRKLGEYREVVDKAITEFMPHYICTYLYELAQVFNSFYEHNRVLGDEREATRLELVKRYADTLKNGLELLNIPAPERM